MVKKPTYEELEKRVRALEGEVLQVGRAEEALQESEELRQEEIKYGPLIESSLTGIYIDQDEKGGYLVDRVRKLNAEGVIFASPSFCDPALLESPMLQRALTEADIPYTAFKFSENSGQYQAIKEQTGTFSDSIKLWGTA